MALEDNLLAGRDAAGLGLRVADCFFHRTCYPRVARTRDGGYGFRSPTLLAWSWIATQSRRLFAVQSARARINYLINLSLFAGVTAVILSGILISEKAIPTLTGTKAAPDMDWRWDVLHKRFSEAVVTLSGLHLAINWDWALAAVQKVLFPWVEKVQGRFRRFREGAL
jgi:Domain of unknown function (DUF4405)